MKSFIFEFVVVLSLFNSLLGASMGNFQFVDCHDPILNMRSQAMSEAEIKDPAMQEWFDGVLSFARGEQSDEQRAILVGLAAPQIGKSIRVILVDIKADGKGGVSELQLYINPEIIETSEETEEWYEGCFSTGNVKGIVRRPSQVTIRALNRNGDEIFETHSGYVARIFQHEIDHLNGVRFPERIPSQQQIHIVKEGEMYAYRNQQAWRSWKHTVPQHGWKEHMK